MVTRSCTGRRSAAPGNSATARSWQTSPSSVSWRVFAAPMSLPAAGGRPDGLSPADGAATLTEMTAAAVAAALRHFPSPPREWLVCGGGRHNPELMAALARLLATNVRPVEAAGWDGDALEAQAFAYL